MRYLLKYGEQIENVKYYLMHNFKEHMWLLAPYLTKKLLLTHDVKAFSDPTGHFPFCNCTRTKLTRMHVLIFIKCKNWISFFPEHASDQFRNQTSDLNVRLNNVHSAYSIHFTKM